MCINVVASAHRPPQPFPPTHTLESLFFAILSQLAMGERRAQNDGRFDTLDARVTQVENDTWGLKRRMDRITKGCTLVSEGLVLCEKLFTDMITPQEKKWRELKSLWPETLCKDLASHLGVEWPPAGASLEATRVKQLLELLTVPNTVCNVYGQERWVDAQQSRQRIQGTFRIHLEFGPEMLECRKVMRELEKDLRNKKWFAGHR